MRIIIEKDYAGVSRRAADFVEALLRRKPNAVLGLATGSTPLGLYRELIRRHKDEGLDFSGVTTFNLDEYYGLAPDHPQSYHHFMRVNLFDHINVPGDNINIPSGTAKNIAKSCDDYERKIREFGGIDLQILGIGSDGHIAFNEPGSSLASRTRPKTLAPETIRDNARFFGEGEEVPKFAITMAAYDRFDFFKRLNCAKKVGTLDKNGRDLIRELVCQLVKIGGPLRRIGDFFYLETAKSSVCSEQLAVLGMDRA